MVAEERYNCLQDNSGMKDSQGRSWVSLRVQDAVRFEERSPVEESVEPNVATNVVDSVLVGGLEKSGELLADDGVVGGGAPSNQGDVLNHVFVGEDVRKMGEDLH